MIEAVNSVLQTAPFVRANNEQISTADSFAANPERLQRAPQAPQAPFISPYIYLDVNYDKAVIQLRNGDTGDVIDQFPSESALQARARQSAQQQVARETQAQQAPQPQASVETSAPQQSAPEASQANTAAINAQQQAAFQAAAQTGISNAGNVTVFA